MGYYAGAGAWEAEKVATGWIPLRFDFITSTVADS